MKTGKEADVYLIRRDVPGRTGHACSRPSGTGTPGTACSTGTAGYLEGRRTRESRVNRATANRSAFGKRGIAGQWANAEFTALCRLHGAKVTVPYPVQITGTEVLLEFIGRLTERRTAAGGDPPGRNAPRQPLGAVRRRA